MNVFNLPLRVEIFIKRKGDAGEDEFLMVRRVPNDGGFWQPVTGTPQSDETIEQALFRELGEETAITKKDVLDLSDFVHTFTWQKESTGMVITEYVFVATVNSNVQIVLSPEEHDAYEWNTYEKCLELMKMENNKIALRKCVNPLL